MGLEDDLDICLWKKSIEHKKKEGIPIDETSKIHTCSGCPGTQGSCPNFSSYNKVMDTYDLRR